MRSRRRRSLPRRSGRGLEAGVPVSRLEWSRREQAARHPPAAPRLLALAAAALEAVILVWLLAGSVFGLNRVEVTGVSHLTAAQVRQAAGVAGHPSLLALDADTIRRKLEQLPWVRSASVTAELPSSLLIQVQEWRPVAAYGAGGSYYLLNGQAVVLEKVPPPTGLLAIDGPAHPSPRAGQRALDPELLSALVNLAGAFPLATGQTVAHLDLDACDDLTLTASDGFRVMFGRMLTPEQFASLQQKVDALAALRGIVSYGSRDLDYVNVENPSAPAVHLHSAKPAPAPTPAPTPTGIQVIGCP